MIYYENNIMKQQVNQLYYLILLQQYLNKFIMWTPVSQKLNLVKPRQQTFTGYCKRLYESDSRKQKQTADKTQKLNFSRFSQKIQAECGKYSKLDFRPNEVKPNLAWIFQESKNNVKLKSSFQNQFLAALKTLKINVKQSITKYEMRKVLIQLSFINNQIRQANLVDSFWLLVNQSNSVLMLYLSLQSIINEKIVIPTLNWCDLKQKNELISMFTDIDFRNKLRTKYRQMFNNRMRRPRSNRSEKDKQEPTIICQMQIQLSNNINEKLIVFNVDNPNTIALKLSKKYELSEQSTLKLQQAIKLRWPRKLYA